MNLNEKMKKITNEYKKTDPHDWVKIEECWDSMFDALSEDYSAMVEYYKNATADELIISAEIWDDLIVFWNKKELLSVYRECIENNPSISDNLITDFNNAKEAFENDK